MVETISALDYQESQKLKAALSVDEFEKLMSICDISGAEVKLQEEQTITPFSNTSRRRSARIASQKSRTNSPNESTGRNLETIY